MASCSASLRSSLDFVGLDFAEWDGRVSKLLRVSLSHVFPSFISEHGVCIVRKIRTQLHSGLS